MRFVETRGNDGSHAESVSFSDAILSPLASFGGIYSPETLPRLDQDFLESQLSASYKSLALSYRRKTIKNYNIWRGLVFVSILPVFVFWLGHSTHLCLR